MLLLFLIPLTLVDAKSQHNWKEVFAVRAEGSAYVPLAEDPNSGMLYAGTGGQGIMQSSDNGRSWVSNNELNGAQHLAISPVSGHLYAWIPGRRGLWQHVPKTGDWSNLRNLEDRGSTAGMAITSLGTIIVAVSASNNSEAAIYRSTNGGISWKLVIRTEFMNNLAVFGLEANPANGDLYLGISDGAIYRSKDDGLSWQNLRPSSAQQDWVISFAFSPNGEIFAGANRQIFRSSDDGASWQRVHENLQKGSGFFLGMAINAEGHIYTCQNNRGHELLVSRDDGASWQDISTGPARSREQSSNILISREGFLIYSTTRRIFRSSERTEPPAREGFAYVNGAVVIDYTSNCKVDTEDFPLPERIIEVLPGPFYTHTDREGHFGLFLPEGSYTIRTPKETFWRNTCSDPAGQNISVNKDDLRSDLNFFLEPEQYMQVLQVSVAVSQARPGFELDYTISYKNIGTMPFTGTLKFHFDPILEFLTSQPDADRNTAAQLEWDFAALPILDRGSIDLKFRVPRSTPRGTTVCAEVYYNNNPDLLAFSAADYGYREEICAEVRGSYDPNDIQVFPAGEGPKGIIGRLDSVLSYLIRFQNTGNDTAFTVKIRDTLSDLHDMRTLRFGAASHPYEVVVSDEGALEFRFNNILLPDSNTNEAGSHGYLRYSVEFRDDTELGSAIENRAAIYFDFNDPVITNTVRNTLSSPVDVGRQTEALALSIYPNPVSDVLVLQSELLPGARISIVNRLGQTVAHSRQGPETRARLEVGDLPAGVYLMTIQADNLRIARSIVVQ